MANEVGTMSSLKKIELQSRPLQISDVKDDILYIGAIGFEDRAFGFLNEALKQKKHFKKSIAIKYNPNNFNNREAEFFQFTKNIFQENVVVTYDRFCPDNFNAIISEIVQCTQTVSQVIIDVSAMSKMLIVVLLYGLRNVNLPLSIIYAPAKVYHPLRDNFEAVKSKIEKESSDVSPYFLTTDVYTVVTTTTLSSIAMQGAPLAMIAFPNFNYLEIAALLNETNAQKLFLIESIKDLGENSWRLDAIRWINRGLKSYVTPTNYVVEASDINANIKVLEEIYQQEKLSHKIALSPTGGKLQAVAAFCLKIMHPDIHIIYPVVRQFAQDYTEGYQAHLEFFLPSFSKYVNTLNDYRKSELFEIAELIKRKLGFT
ncbi:MAG: hypothetical protein ACQCN5_13460 [Candidatus Bathyarchaeia archaeon]|jgi:hypothetical protein